MSLLKPKSKAKKETVRIKVSSGLLTHIKKYSEWAELDKIDDFFEQAAELVFSKDKDWLKKVGAIKESKE